MGKPHRIAAGGLTFQHDAVLLVRYQRSNGETYLVGPGGALKDKENVIQAITREIQEETGLVVQPERVVAIEDLLCAHFKMSKVWMTCQVVAGELRNTQEAKKEGIVEVGWFTKEQLNREVVFPALLMEHDWNELQSERWSVKCSPSRAADF